MRTWPDDEHQNRTSIHWPFVWELKCYTSSIHCRWNLCYKPQMSPYVKALFESAQFPYGAERWYELHPKLRVPASYAGTRQGAFNGLNRPAMQTKPIFWESYLIDRVLIGRRACLVSTLQTYFVGMRLENENLNPSQEYCSGFVINFKANPKACIILFRL